jgi:antitoxin component YwqK of YwqJK toxin-antitoxin module
MPSLLRQPTLLFALLLAAGLPAHAVQDCDIAGVSVNPANGNTTAGKSGLMRCKDRDTGQIQREQQLQNGAFRGLVRSYQEGRPFKEYQVDARGNMEGPAREFAPNGQVVRQSVYVDGNERGLVQTFYPSGARQTVAFNGENGREAASVEFTPTSQPSALRCADQPLLAPAFDDARACGFAGSPSSVELFDARGRVRQRVSYVRGQRVRWETLFDNGQPETTSEITGGESVGRRFWASGAKRQEIHAVVIDRRTVRQRELDYSERGTLVRDQRWAVDGTPTNDDSFYLNGQPRSRAVFGGAGAQRFVDVTEFYDSGKRSGAGRYRAGPRGAPTTPLGIHQQFHEQGSLAAETTYDERGRVTRERAFDEAGRLQRDDEVFEDGSRKAFAKPQ